VSLSKFHINGVILAGGKGTRMHFQEKPLLMVGQKRVIDWILQAASSQVENLVLNINRETEQYVSLGLPMVTDATGVDGGPLAGIYAAMCWNSEVHPESTHLACFPGDVPWFDANYVQRSMQMMAREHTQIGWLQTHLQRQPLFSVWEMTLAPVLKDALCRGVYSPMSFIQSQRNSMVLITDTHQGHYWNLNTPEDLLLAQTMAEQWQNSAKTPEVTATSAFSS